MRKARKFLAMTLPILGTILVFLAILVPVISANLQIQVTVVLIGILVIEAGVWRLTSRILPNERKYLALRAEVRAFVDRVRVLNADGVKLRAAYTESDREAFLATLDSLHAAVDRMAKVAGREYGDDGHPGSAV